MQSLPIPLSRQIQIIPKDSSPHFRRDFQPLNLLSLIILTFHRSAPFWGIWSCEFGENSRATSTICEEIDEKGSQTVACTANIFDVLRFQPVEMGSEFLTVDISDVSPRNEGRNVPDDLEVFHVFSGDVTLETGGSLFDTTEDQFLVRLRWVCGNVKVCGTGTSIFFTNGDIIVAHHR